MSVTILAVGKIKQGPESDLLNEYIKRIRWNVSMVELPQSKHQTADARKKDEAERLLKQVPDAACLITLDERGKLPDTAKFSQLVNRTIEDSQPLVFIVGGADGLDKAVRQRANHIIAFGAMTWPHKLVRAMLAEQIYRAYTLATGHPYHRD